MMKDFTLAPLGHAQTQRPQLSQMHQRHMPWQGTSRTLVRVSNHKAVLYLGSHLLLEQQLCVGRLTGMSRRLQLNPQRLLWGIRGSKQPEQLPSWDLLAILSHSRRRNSS